ncbi:MAG: hypothetical protein R2710_15630 [Acidimicrobiales bacterium]
MVSANFALLSVAAFFSAKTAAGQISTRSQRPVITTSRSNPSSSSSSRGTVIRPAESSLTWRVSLIILRKSS